jgi:hypothetical protein
MKNTVQAHRNGGTKARSPQAATPASAAQASPDHPAQVSLVLFHEADGTLAQVDLTAEDYAAIKARASREGIPLEEILRRAAFYSSNFSYAHWMNHGGDLRKAAALMDLLASKFSQMVNDDGAVIDGWFISGALSLAMETQASLVKSYEALYDATIPFRTEVEP